jgi:hypothetical protein
VGVCLAEYRLATWWKHFEPLEGCRKFKEITMSKTVAVIVFISLLMLSGRTLAQDNEVSVSLGGSFTPGSTTSQFENSTSCTITNPNCESFADRFHINSQISFEGVYARRFMQAKVASLYFELPVLGVPSRHAESSASTVPLFGTTVSRTDLSSIFITPSLRAKFVPNAIVSPFASIGEGLGRFASHTEFALSTPTGPIMRGSQTNSSNKFAFQFGGGLDFKTPIRNLGFRLEVRDFMVGRSGLDFGPDDHHHNIFAGAGVVFHF